MKRPSCKWKGQTDADEESTGSAGSPISRMPQKTKGGLQPTRQPSTAVYHNFQPVQPNTTKIVNVLIQMKADNKSDYTIHFTNKSLTYLSKHTSLNYVTHAKKRAPKPVSRASSRLRKLLKHYYAYHTFWEHKCRKKKNR